MMRFRTGSGRSSQRSILGSAAEDHPAQLVTEPFGNVRSFFFAELLSEIEEGVLFSLFGFNPVCGQNYPLMDKLGLSGLHGIIVHQFDAMSMALG